jgi:hypothetical protein
MGKKSYALSREKKRAILCPWWIEQCFVPLVAELDLEAGVPMM